MESRVGSEIGSTNNDIEFCAEIELRARFEIDIRFYHALSDANIELILNIGLAWRSKVKNGTNNDLELRADIELRIRPEINISF